MKATRSTAAKRLFKRLSALRATLPADERKILDEFLVTEVEAHQLKGRQVTRQANRAAGKEVEAHQLKGRIATRQTERAAEKQADKTATKTTFRIAYDPNSEEYRIVD